MRYLLMCASLLALVLTGCGADLEKPDYPERTLYAAAYGDGVYHTDNGGRSWFLLGAEDGPLPGYHKRLARAPGDPEGLYVLTTGAGAFRMDRRSGSLRRLEGIPSDRVQCAAFPEPWLLGTARHGVLAGKGRQGTWAPWNHGLPYRGVQALLALGPRVYAATVNGVFVRGRDEAAWAPAHEGLVNLNVYTLAADPSGETLMAGCGPYPKRKPWFTRIPSLYQSRDRGRTWSPSDEGLPDGTLVYDCVVDPQSPGRIHLGTSNGVFASSDRGAHWERQERGLPASAPFLDIEVLPRGPGEASHVYAAGPSGVYMTTDTPETAWISAGFGLPDTTVSDVLGPGPGGKTP